MKIIFKKCKFNLGLEMEASASKTNKPYNLHIYLFFLSISISPIKYYVPIRISFGLREIKTNFYINIGLLNYNLMIQYMSEALVHELYALVIDPHISQFSIYLNNINNVKNKKFYLFPIVGHCK